MTTPRPRTMAYARTTPRLDDNGVLEDAVPDNGGVCELRSRGRGVPEDVAPKDDGIRKVHARG